MRYPHLEPLGWSAELELDFAPHALEGSTPARVAVEHRIDYVLATGDGDVRATLAGRLRHEAATHAELPAVGDWVAVKDLVVQAVLPRRSAFVRKAAGVGAAAEQVVAANVDTVFLVSSLNRDLNLRRLERYLTIAWESGASPAVVLSKRDLCPDLAGALAEVETVAMGVPVHAISALTGEGFDELAGYFAGNRTVALLGSSGVGKSTIANRLLGADVQEVQEIRTDDDRGRHTTVRRELRPLPGGGLVLDTPGMRELQLWETDTGLDDAFDDLAELAGACRFGDCAHESEPGCAVVAAIERGALAPERLESWRKLQRELRHLELKVDPRAAAEERKRRRAFGKSLRRASW